MGTTCKVLQMSLPGLRIKLLKVVEPKFLFFLYQSVVFDTFNSHKREKVWNMGGGGWGVGGKVQNIGGPRGGGKVFAGCKLIGPPTPNQCQIITFLKLKTDNIAKL